LIATGGGVDFHGFGRGECVLLFKETGGGEKGDQGKKKVFRTALRKFNTRVQILERDA